MILKTREPFNAISHLSGAVVSLLGCSLLLAWGGGSPAKIIALVIYGISLVALFSASGVYHAVTASPGVLKTLRKVDHSAIFLLIAGTYTPFCILVFTGFWSWGLLAVIWSLALAGIVMKVFIIHISRWLTVGIYIVMGWLCVIAVPKFIPLFAPTTVAWLLAGGILYTVGAVIYATKKGNFFPGVFGFHEVWHLFVLLGAAAHFVSVATIL